MPLLLVLIAMISPRILLFFIWLLTAWTSKAFVGHLWPIMGFIFMPITTMLYMWAAISSNHEFGAGWVVVIIIGVLADISSDGMSAS